MAARQETRMRCPKCRELSYRYVPTVARWECERRECRHRDR